MNQKWRMLLGISLVVMVCVPGVSAAIKPTIIKHSVNWSYLDLLSTAQSTQVIQVPFDISTTKSFNNTKKVDLAQLARYSIRPSFLTPDLIVPMCGDPIDLVFDGEGIIVENTHPISGYKRGC